MGSTSMGVMWGVDAPADVRFSSDDGSRKPGLLAQYARATKRAAPVEAFDDGLVGYWVAVHRSDDDSVPDLVTGVAFEDFPTSEAYAESYRGAVRRWDEFAAWCAAQGTALPTARLYLAQTEVG